MDIEHWQQWIGKEQITEALISVETANLMQATLNREAVLQKHEELPPAWHWLYFHEATRAGKLGSEGHAQLGDFMPPISFSGNEPPRRMWAGGKLLFEKTIHLGDVASKRSTIKSITPKDGRSGKLVFVVVGHEISVDGSTCIVEEQTLVYREPVKANPGGAKAPAAPQISAFSATYQSDPVLLFRYSALTFNGHRIHYDLDYCRNHEGYPDLVVHGPLLATLMLDLFTQQIPGKPIRSFEYRARSPVFNPEVFTVNGTSDGAAWVSDAQGGLAMSAQIGY